MNKILIVYFSHRGENYWNGGMKVLTKGNTEIAAEMIAKITGGDLFEVETVRPYSEHYRECVQEAREEFMNQTRPALKTYPDGVEDYDTIFVGYPNWCGTMPMAMLLFWNIMIGQANGFFRFVPMKAAAWAAVWPI